MCDENCGRKSSRYSTMVPPPLRKFFREDFRDSVRAVDVRRLDTLYGSVARGLTHVPQL